VSRTGSGKLSTYTCCVNNMLRWLLSFRMSQVAFAQIMVFRGKWLWSPANIKGGNKDVSIYVGRSTTVHNLLFFAHTLWMNYVTKMFLLVSSSVRSKQLLNMVKAKKENKNTQQRNLPGFITIPLCSNAEIGNNCYSSLLKTKRWCLPLFVKERTQFKGHCVAFF